MSTPAASVAHALRFAYSTINWGTKPDLAAAFGEIRAAGWQALELFDHSLDWLGTPQHLTQALGGLHAATFFGGAAIGVFTSAPLGAGAPGCAPPAPAPGPAT